ncbi:MAG: 50S ribosomal protein L16 [Simkaniaceae bacterium]|nr:50S ribosomal protein L16 [Simkaniaceae bacterium]
MPLVPAKPKFRKQQKGSMKGIAKRGWLVRFGDYGMQILERGRITNRQIEACRVAINRYFHRKGKVWIRIFPDKPITKKPAETRMGKGKGGTDHWVAVAKPGRILFEVGNVTRDEAQAALLKAAAKLPFRTRFVERMEQV